MVPKTAMKNINKNKKNNRKKIIKNNRKNKELNKAFFIRKALIIFKVTILIRLFGD